jgi:hypothetical protein
MTNSPKRVTREKLQQIYDEHLCDARLDQGNTEIIDSRPYTLEETKLSGVVEFRLISRTSKDGTCVLLADVFVHEDGTHHTVIVVLEIDGQEYCPEYDDPQPIGGKF